MRTVTPKIPRMTFLAGLLIAVVALMLLLHVCSRSHNSSSDYNRSGGDTIDVAIEYGPLSLYRYSDTLGGFAYDLLRHISAIEDIPVKFHPVATLAQALDGIGKDHYRLVVAALPLNAVMQEKYAATEPVYLDRQVLVQRTDSAGRAEVNSQLDLARKAVWVMAGSPAVQRLNNLADEIGDTIFIVENEEYGSEQLFILAVTGEIPRAVVTERTARKLLGDFPEANISTAVSFTQFQSWLTAKDDTALLARIDSAIVAVKPTPFYKALVDRYF